MTLIKMSKTKYRSNFHSAYNQIFVLGHEVANYESWRLFHKHSPSGRTQQRPSRKTNLEASLPGRTIVLLGRTIVLKNILPGRTIVKLFHKHAKFLRGRTLLRPSRKARVYGTASCVHIKTEPSEKFCDLVSQLSRTTWDGGSEGV